MGKRSTVAPKKSENSSSMNQTREDGDDDDEGEERILRPRKIRISRAATLTFPHSSIMAFSPSSSLTPRKRDRMPEENDVTRQGRKSNGGPKRQALLAEEKNTSGPFLRHFFALFGCRFQAAFLLPLLASSSLFQQRFFFSPSPFGTFYVSCSSSTFSPESSQPLLLYYYFSPAFYTHQDRSSTTRGRAICDTLLLTSTCLTFVARLFVAVAYL